MTYETLPMADPFRFSLNYILHIALSHPIRNLQRSTQHHFLSDTRFSFCSYQCPTGYSDHSMATKRKGKAQPAQQIKHGYRGFLQ